MWTSEAVCLINVCHRFWKTEELCGNDAWNTSDSAYTQYLAFNRYLHLFCLSWYLTITTIKTLLKGLFPIILFSQLEVEIEPDACGWKNNNSDVTETLKTIKSFGGVTIIWQPSTASLKPYENLMVVTVCVCVHLYMSVWVFLIWIHGVLAWLHFHISRQNAFKKQFDTRWREAKSRSEP